MRTAANLPETAVSPDLPPLAERELPTDLPLLGALLLLSEALDSFHRLGKGFERAQIRVVSLQGPEWMPVLLRELTECSRLAPGLSLAALFAGDAELPQDVPDTGWRKIVTTPHLGGGLATKVKLHDLGIPQGIGGGPPNFPLACSHGVISDQKLLKRKKAAAVTAAGTLPLRRREAHRTRQG